ncbi:MAG: hypothetical protein WKF76_13190 [Nocardioidaceae bacterium]
MDALRETFPRTRGWFTAAGILIGLFLLAPLATILPLAFTKNQYLVFPPELLSGQWFSEVLGDAAWQGAIRNSAQVAIGGRCWPPSPERAPPSPYGDSLADAGSSAPRCWLRS